jgi:hypothetical protein
MCELIDSSAQFVKILEGGRVAEAGTISHSQVTEAKIDPSTYFFAVLKRG